MICSVSDFSRFSKSSREFRESVVCYAFSDGCVRVRFDSGHVLGSTHFEHEFKFDY